MNAQNTGNAGNTKNAKNAGNASSARNARNAQTGTPVESADPRIGLFYSLGPHFLRTLGRLKADYPGAAVTVMIPPGYPLSDKERDLVDTFVETELTHYSPKNAGPCLRLLRQIRGERYDLFVVMFESPQLRTLSALSGARQRACCLPGGHLVPLNSSLLRVLADECMRRIWGRIAYAGIWLAIRVLPVRPRP